MFPFTPRYLKNAKLLLKGANRFLDYKRDLMTPAKVAEITTLRDEYKAAMRARDMNRLDELGQKLNSVCENALPSPAPSWMSENIEVIFVAIVIALGIRAYFATLFQIPTGSMQPTLNGITAEATAEDPTPGLLGRLLGRLKGERYVNEVSMYEGALDPKQPLTEERFLIFMPYCLLHFQDGHTQKIGVPMRQLIEDFNFWRNIQSEVTTTGEITPDAREVQVLKAGGVYVHKGQLLARGILRNGDQVIVDKISYHFRRPQRGEVFVFTTKNIRVIESQSNFDPRQGSQHYIKRLAAVPGDHLQVEEPKLYINGKLAEEPGFARVMQGSPDAPVDGYKGYGDARRINGLRINAIDIDNEHYFAMGDNSFNSFDSRGWGPVPARNLVGPALWTYWPLNKHWGPIK